MVGRKGNGKMNGTLKKKVVCREIGRHHHCHARSSQPDRSLYRMQWLAEDSAAELVQQW